MTGNCSFNLEGIDEEGRLQLVTGKIASGKTSFGISLAEQEEEIISNLESVEGAFYANSPEAVKAILKLKPETKFAVLLDDITANLSYDVERRQIVELVSNLVDAGHRVILTGTVLDDFPAELLYFGEGEWDDATRDVYHLPERGRAEYREIYRVGGQLDTETACSFPAAHPSQAFDSQEIPEFEFDVDEDDQKNEPKYDEGDLILTPEEYDKSDPQTYIRDGFKIVGWYESGDEIVYQLSYVPEDQDDGEIFESDIEEKGSIEVVEDGGYIHNYKKNREEDLTKVSGVGLVEEARLRREGYTTVEDLQVATQSDLSSVDGIGNALAARIKADVGEVEQDEELSLSEFLELSRGQQRKRVKIALAQQTADDELPDDLFQPDERFPPQIHLDHLESQLDYNLGQVDGFFELDWSEKCDVAKIAANNDLGLEATENIIQRILASAGDASC
ncbi:hypothetical protein HZS55_12960 [Halosimplex rubrum]|uniref:Helix-hairpin-helix domain-containing protein n=1 Tax=Halosimplex rubrum TaxID=869889 RepID=A0A7D5P5V9_9EURY|nr:helix-hairpin-helix domain-containing protein [Halosimplex rubrum]QLH78158.1 hypothetical protein HZS55_12960 [Halosimplex rubrum]